MPASVQTIARVYNRKTRFECHLMVCGSLRISVSLRTEPIREPPVSENHEPNRGYPDSVRLEQL
jgi:hypothetical protein